MKLKDLLNIWESNKNLSYSVIAKDGREFDIEEIDGDFFENLLDAWYVIDNDYSYETDDNGDDFLTSYDILMLYEDFCELEIARIDDENYDTLRIYLKEN